MTKEEFEKELELFDYEYPEELIATSPAHPRDSAKLLVYSKKENKIETDVFGNIISYLPEKSVLVFNETKVIPARLTLEKPTGGKVKVLIVGVDNNLIKVMSDRKIAPKDVLSVSGVDFLVFNQAEKYFYLLPPEGFIENNSFTDAFYKLLDEVGDVPLPPYIKNTPLERDELLEEYQTVFAKVAGSFAAPTASLHFTNELIEKIKEAGHEVVFITLHVGLGTFAPLTEENLLSGKLHKEYYEISDFSAKIITDAKLAGRKIISVGTTATRALESSCVLNSGRISASVGNGMMCRLQGETDLFIREGYEFKIIDGMITNFHVPKSSLMMLVSALIGREKLLELYRFAIDKKFRLFSFGDGMLVI